MEIVIVLIVLLATGLPIFVCLGFTTLIFMYISEISPAKYRGRFTITFQLAIVLGILFAFLSDYLLIDTGENNWRWMFIFLDLHSIFQF